VPRAIPTSRHADEVVAVTFGYGDDIDRPEDFLDSFTGP
jgi:hypothetical protein